VFVTLVAGSEDSVDIDLAIGQGCITGVGLYVARVGDPVSVIR
jgi:hypothetical protein